MKNRKLHLILLLVIGIYTNSCVEPFDFKTITFESALVIEATITNELKYQEINLSRTFKLEENGPSAESNADVKIVDDLQNTYNFQETSSGKYISEIEFRAVPNRSYQLMISTNDGRSYLSENIQLTNIVDIGNVYTLVADNDEGISIFVDSFNPSGNARYYRYEYEETYKVIAPYWSAYDAVVVSDVPPYEVDIVPRTQEERVCFNTINSTGIIQTETNSFSEDRVTKFQIRYLSKDNFIISHRYSILVKQYVQSQEAYTFYKTLNELSGSESLFSQNQPGFISGNIYSNEDANEKVIGFFEVSSVSKKRIFFNTRDLIPFRPSYIVDCELKAPRLRIENGSSPLIESIKSGRVKFFHLNDTTSYDLIEPGGPYIMVPLLCGDCTTFGTNIMPDFWIE